MNPFSEIAARDWVAEHIETVGSKFPSVFLLGRDPFDPDELASFFATHGCPSITENKQFEGRKAHGQDWHCKVYTKAPVVVLGRTPPHADSLASLLRPDAELCVKSAPDPLLAGAPYWLERACRRGIDIFRRSHSLEKLQFISQEYAVAHFLIRAAVGASDAAWDDHEHEHDVLKRLPAIRKQSLDREPDFLWPSTEAPGGDGSADIKSPEFGYLSKRGYHVGKNGRSEIIRQKILEDCFRDPFLDGLEANYRKEWADALTWGRLKKIAFSIATFARNAKRNDPVSFAKAINEWETDLRWLKTTFYNGRFDGRFAWPSSDKE
jgi:hypothetical protein